MINLLEIAGHVSDRELSLKVGDGGNREAAYRTIQPDARGHSGRLRSRNRHQRHSRRRRRVRAELPLNEGNELQATARFRHFLPTLPQ